ERGSIELTLRGSGDRLPESDPLGWQALKFCLEREVRNDPPTTAEVADQRSNVVGETAGLLSRQVADQPFAQDHQRSRAVEHRSGTSQLFAVEGVGSGHDVQRVSPDIVPPPQLVEQLELRRDDTT